MFVVDVALIVDRINLHTKTPYLKETVWVMCSLVILVENTAFSGMTLVIPTALFMMRTDYAHEYVGRP
jgi:hypothetical protein